MTRETIAAMNGAHVAVYKHKGIPVAYELCFNGMFQRYKTEQQAVAVFNWIVN